MAHYFVHQERLGSPFTTVREMKMVIPAGEERRQSSKHPKVLFILDGECRVRMVDGFTAHLKRGDALLVPKPCHHSYTSLGAKEDAEVHAFGLFFDRITPLRKRQQPYEAEWFRILGTLFPENRHFTGIVDPGILALINAFREEHTSAKPGSLLKQKGLCTEIVVELARRLAMTPTVGEAPALIRSHAFVASEVKEYLGKTVHRKHTLPGIAWKFHLSEEHLARIFKKETGLTVMGYLRKIRVDAAMGMLLGTNHTVASLGALLGFSSSNHFCRAFVQLTGQTPMEYRQKHAGMNDPHAKRKATRELLSNLRLELYRAKPKERG